jgi:hypothetical protein
MTIASGLAAVIDCAPVAQSQDLRGGLINMVYSLRQHGTSYFLFFVFALAERKNEKQ